MQNQILSVQIAPCPIGLRLMGKKMLSATCTHLGMLRQGMRSMKFSSSSDIRLAISPTVWSPSLTQQTYSENCCKVDLKLVLVCCWGHTISEPMSCYCLALLLPEPAWKILAPSLLRLPRSHWTLPTQTCRRGRFPSPVKAWVLGHLQGLAKRLRPGLVNFVTAVAYHFCLAYLQHSRNLAEAF